MPTDLRDRPRRQSSDVDVEQYRLQSGRQRPNTLPQRIIGMSTRRASLRLAFLTGKHDASPMPAVRALATIDRRRDD